MRRVVEALERDGVVIYPTDSVYAFGCSVQSPKAVERLRRMRGKSADDMTLVFSGIAQVAEYCRVDNAAFRILKRNLPGPFTFVLPASSRIPDKALGRRRTIGVRIPSNAVARAVVEAVCGQYHNEIGDGLKIYFCGNTISPSALNDIIALTKGKRFSINVISKSGTTTETALAFRVLRKLLEDSVGPEEANKRIYATTDRAKGTLKQLTSDEQGWPERVLAVSDDYVLLKITDDKGYFSPYLLDINSENPASVIIPANYKDDQDNEIGLFEDAGDTYNAFIKGDLLYDFHKKGTDIICNILRIVDGSLLFEDQIVIQSEDSEGWELEKLSSADFSIGLILASHYSSTTMLSDSLIRVNLNGTDVTVDEVVLDANAKTAAHFETVGDRVYWIAGANDNNGSFICYHDFGTDSTVRKPIPGKAAASSELSVSEDGTVVYTQFMDIVDTGTFSWNPDKEEEPTLLMLEEADVHSIVSINKL